MASQFGKLRLSSPSLQARKTPLCRQYKGLTNVQRSPLAVGGLNWKDEYMDFPYGFWEQGADSWLHELDFLTTEAEPQLQSLADDSAIERAKPWILDHFRRRSRPSGPIPRGVDISWYSSPPKLQIYDKEVLNVLLNVARRHLGTTFELYANYEAQGDSEPELCLAMAAVGALYLGAECGATLSKALYNDARRLHFQNSTLEVYKHPSG
ncbi:hypothetical protein LTR12_018164 [Friedmanniomyces endolithicus]|nr:hypothetical protein LTR12_018164 [Friedmanniomyces endolithicus]